MPNTRDGCTRFHHSDVDIENRQLVYRGFFKMEQLSLRHRLFNGGWSPVIKRELFVRGDAVAAVLYDPDNGLIGLVEQFRIGAIDGSESPWLCEVVAGMAEAGENSEQVILRELREEADIEPEHLLPICDYFSSPGGTDERLSLYCALGDLRDRRGVYGLAEEGEDIRLLILPEQDVFANLYGGRFNNAATLICLQWLQQQREEIIATYSDG